MPKARLKNSDLPATVYVQWDEPNQSERFLLADQTLECAAENAESDNRVVGEYQLVRKFTTRRDVEVVCEPVE
jgi:hypothetical protein